MFSDELAVTFRNSSGIPKRQKDLALLKDNKLPMPMKLSDERLKREMGELTSDLVALFEAKYPRFYNALKGQPEDKLIELMIELCDVFDLHKQLTGEIAARYKEHRLHAGSMEDRDWPEN